MSEWPADKPKLDMKRLARGWRPCFIPRGKPKSRCKHCRDETPPDKLYEFFPVVNSRVKELVCKGCLKRIESKA